MVDGLSAGTKRVTALLTYWRGLAGDQPAPLRRKVDPRQVKELLPRLFVISLKAADQPRFTLAGTALCAIWGTELRNRPAIDLIAPGYRPLFMAAVQAVSEVPCPSLSSVCLRSDNLEVSVGQLVLLPLRDEDHTISTLLGYLDITLPARLHSVLTPSLDIGDTRLVASGLRRQAPSRRAFGTLETANLDTPNFNMDGPAAPALLPSAGGSGRPHLRLVVDRDSSHQDA